ncbi:restriction endonuclease subunit S [Leptospira kirschneri]|uniref:restriction endonuclease subunit S n=1 Tax=Leptospira kirschneri TaxID=29507 RepID=UPI000382ED56|nr:restriction endonuclease subunit S [Leptospira kirschneri]
MEKLLDGASVEWKTLGEIFDLRNGYTPSKSNSEYWEDGTIPWFRMEDIRENGQILNDALQKVATNALKGGKLFPANSIIVATSATIGEHALITVPYLSNQRFTNLILKSEHSDRFEIKFLFYYCFLLDDWCKNNTTVSSFASVDMNGFRKFQIPIPPLPVQAEIVRILDAFTELTARKKQYNYYRDQLLSFEEGEVEWKTLGEVYKFQYGTGNTIPTIGGKYPVYGSNGIVGTHNEYNSEDSPVIGHIGAYAGIVNWGEGKHFVTYNGVICKLINDFVNPKYAYYQLLKQDFNSMAKSASHPFISYAELNKAIIPIPSLAEQKRIVAILDKFDALTSSISEGLPREIRLRQKQYEYYRELLLSFPKPDRTK